MMYTFMSVVALVVSAVNGAAAVDWSTLPWDDLSSQLSESSKLIVSDGQAQVATFNAECVPEMLKPQQERTMHDLINQPGGLCMDQMACAFDECNPLNPETYPDITVEERLHSLVDNMDGDAIDILFSATPVTNLPKNQSMVDAWLEADNLAWNLPTTVLFPVTAGDIVAAINFAKTHGLEVSVKNSGHSYTGASMKKYTLHINMNNYTMYAANGIVDCNETADKDAPFRPDLSDQACRFAKGRGTNGIIRVGGGENFDKMYRAVKSFNENHKNETGSYKYYNAGGGAGTVSPMGWTFQGGLAWATNSRSIGLGVDQVIQVDMVLPNGEHVRFGPTQWEDQDENFIYPATTKVTGVCLQNPEEEDESKWAWSSCEGDIPFDDLWFALRGGGGGTWGIVTSMIINLHDYLPLELGGSALLSCIPSEATPIYKPYFDRFFAAFLSNPSSIGVTEEEASHCGAFGLGDSPAGNQLFCYGASSSKPFLSAWSVYVSGLNKTLADAGLNTSAINDLASSCGNEVGEQRVDYPGMVILQDGPCPGKVCDAPPPTYLSTTEDYVNMIVPAKYFADNPNASDTFHLFYGAFGANVPYATDQANALSEAHRLGGYMVVLTHDFFDESFYTDIFPQMFDTTDPSNFPGFVGSNHAGPNTRGPLKEDWTKPCPLDWTTAERDEKCISLQEAIWGTKLLRRLEKIKEEIDPNYMFDCYGCVGNNRFRAEGFAVDPNTNGNAGNGDDAGDPGFSVDPNTHGNVGNGDDVMHANIIEGPTPAPAPFTCSSKPKGNCHLSSWTGSCLEHLKYSIETEGQSCDAAVSEIKKQCQECDVCSLADCPTNAHTVNNLKFLGKARSASP